MRFAKRETRGRCRTKAAEIGEGRVRLNGIQWLLSGVATG